MAKRIDPEAARAELSDHDALLVCAYDDALRMHQNWIDGAMTMQELEARADQLAPDQEIIFYCA